MSNINKKERQKKYVKKSKIVKTYTEHEHNGRVNILTKKYKVTYHAAERFLQRVFKQEVTITYEDIIKAAQFIMKSMVDMPKVDGRHKFLDNHLVVVRNGVVTTVLDQ